MLNKSLTITLPQLVFFALALDDSVMRHERGLTLDEKLSSAKRTTLWASPEGIALVLDDVLSRSDKGSGWDQPDNWMYACRRSFPRLVAQVESQGYKVSVRGMTKRVTITKE